MGNGDYVRLLISRIDALIEENRKLKKEIQQLSKEREPWIQYGNLKIWSSPMFKWSR